MMNYSSALLSSLTASALQAAQAASLSAAMSPQASSPSTSSNSGGGGSGIKRSEVHGLPRGWIREEIPAARLYGYHNGVNGTGGPAGSKSEVVYYSPRGQRVRNKTELARLLGDSYDLSTFDFHSGRFAALPSARGHSSSSHRMASNTTATNATPGRPKSSTGRDHVQPPSGASSKSASIAPVPPNDSSLVPPIRQTASIFKQPVTVQKRTNSEETSNSKTKPELKATNAEKPKQLFWEKRLSGLRASYPDEDYQPYELPKPLRPVGPGIGSDVVMASISTSLHLCNGEVKGQPVGKNQADKDPALYLVPDQPMIYAAKIHQDDIERQEAKVAAIRKKLGEALAEME